MAHSHVQRLLREGMGLQAVVQDEDGDYPFRHGTAMYFLTVGPGGHLLRIWCNAVCGIKNTAAVLREVNATNQGMTHGRAFLRGPALVLEAFVPIESLQAGYLVAACQEIGSAADAIGQLMAAVYGGSVAFADEDLEAAG